MSRSLFSRNSTATPKATATAIPPTRLGRVPGKTSCHRRYNDAYCRYHRKSNHPRSSACIREIRGIIPQTAPARNATFPFKTKNGAANPRNRRRSLSHLPQHPSSPPLRNFCASILRAAIDHNHFVLVATDTLTTQPFHPIFLPAEPIRLPPSEGRNASERH